jgi:hypothetical protein
MDGNALPNKGLQATAASVRSCLAVRRNSSHRIPDESGEDEEDILEVSRLTGADRQKGREPGGKAGGAEKAQTAQTRQTCMAWCKRHGLKPSSQSVPTRPIGRAPDDDARPCV